ncbi:hypothetical protein ACQVTS_23630 [Bacillus mycoides]|uniref:hypothetical protein n=1 Tax=Bacillus mycoides TaxID=1405 RepID=UPI003D655ABD
MTNQRVTVNGKVYGLDADGRVTEIIAPNSTSGPGTKQGFVKEGGEMHFYGNGSTKLYREPMETIF